MKEIKITKEDDKGYKTMIVKVPDSWADISLQDYLKYVKNCESMKDSYDVVRVLSNLCNISFEWIMDQPVEVFNEIIKITRFLENPLPQNMSSTIEIEGIPYQMNSRDQITTREYLDIESTMQQKSEDCIPKCLAIVLRPTGEKYDSTKIKERIILFKNQSIETIGPVLQFFLISAKASGVLSQAYSSIIRLVDLAAMLERNFSPSGVNTKSSISSAKEISEDMKKSLT